eukprot:6725151-Pyramimonas_sp.AAC.1
MSVNMYSSALGEPSTIDGGFPNAGREKLPIVVTLPDHALQPFESPYPEFQKERGNSKFTKNIVGGAGDNMIGFITPFSSASQDRASFARDKGLQHGQVAAGERLRAFHKYFKTT